MPEIITSANPVTSATFFLTAEIPTVMAAPGFKYLSVHDEGRTESGQFAYHVCAPVSSVAELRELLQQYIDQVRTPRNIALPYIPVHF